MGKHTKDSTKDAGKAVIKDKTKPTRDMFEQAEQHELAERRRMWLRENAKATPHEPDTKKAAKLSTDFNELVLNVCECGFNPNPMEMEEIVGLIKQYHADPGEESLIDTIKGHKNYRKIIIMMEMWKIDEEEAAASYVEQAEKAGSRKYWEEVMRAHLATAECTTPAVVLISAEQQRNWVLMMRRKQRLLAQK